MEMSAADVKAQYDQQATLFSQLTAIDQSLASISGILDYSSIQFDNAKREMNECYEAVVQANIVLDGFDDYVKLLKDNADSVKKCYDDVETFINPLLSNAMKDVERDLDIVQKYARYLNDKYFFGLSEEECLRFDWEKDYPAYNGEKKYEL